MSERRSRTTFGNRFLAYLAAGLVHIGIVAALVVKFDSNHETIVADDADKIAPVRASTIDESEILNKQAELQKIEEAKKEKERRDREELERLKREKEKEQERLNELQKEKEQSEREAKELEKEREEIALKAKEAREKAEREEKERIRKEEERKEKERIENERIEKERKERERKERERKERERKEAEKRAQEEARLLAERQAAERAASLASKYAALIQQAVRPKVTISPDFHSSLEAEVNVKLTASGEVRQVRILRSSGNVNYDRAVETAIYASSPLPIPSATEDPAVNKQFQDLVLSFSP